MEIYLPVAEMSVNWLVLIALGTGANLSEGAELETRKCWERELASGGWIALEVAPRQISPITAALERRFTEVRMMADLTGRDRFVVGRRS